LRAQQARLDELEKLIQKQKNPGTTNETGKNGEVSSVTPQRNDRPLPDSSSSPVPKPDSVEEKTSENFIVPPRPVKDDGMFAVWGKDGRLTFKNEDGSTVSRLGGLFQFDSGWYIVSDNTNNLLNKPLEQGSDLRRARLRSDGVCYDNLEWVFEFDLSRIGRQQQKPQHGQSARTECDVQQCVFRCAGYSFFWCGQGWPHQGRVELLQRLERAEHSVYGTPRRLGWH